MAAKNHQSEGTVMKRQLIIGLTLVASTLTISAPAHAFKYRLLEVEMTCLEDLPETPLPDTISICRQIVATKDIIACQSAGGQIGAIGTRPACVNERASKARPRGSPPPFFPEEVMAKLFVPVAVPTELHNGQKDPRAGVGRPRPMEPIPVPRTD